MTTPSEDNYVMLLTACQSRLSGYIYSLTGDVDQTRDLLQETNRRLWELRDEYDPTREFHPWAFRIAFNQVRTARKTIKRERLVFCEEETLLAIADEHDSWSQRHDDRVNALRLCLEGLPDDQLELVQGYYHERHSIESISKRKGRRANSVAVALHRIRQILAACVRGKLT